MSMKTENLVNGYVLSNLFYELIFLDEYGVEGNNEDWKDPIFLEDIIHRFIVPMFMSFTPETQHVVRNTIRYLLATKPDVSEIWDAIWQASSAPIPTPGGIRNFIKRCHDILFQNDALPLEDEISKYYVNHSMEMANRLN